MKVVIAREVPAKIERVIAAHFPAAWRIVTISPPLLMDEIGDAEALIPEGTSVGDQLLEHAHNLKIIQTGAGYDNVDMAACSRRGIQVANAAGINARAVAEHVLALIYCWYKNIIKLDAALKRGEFYLNYTGSVLSGKRMGVVGLGHIGREVVRMARAVGIEVIGYHYRPTSAIANIELVDLHALLGRVDIVSVHVALNRQTRHLFDQAEFKRMNPNAFFINTSRGGVVNEKALVEALGNNRIAGAALDVFETEPLATASPLRQLENVILTPHTAGEPDALFFHKQRFEFFAKNLMRVSAGKPPLNLLQPISHPENKEAPKIPMVVLPEGYQGKILLISVSGDDIGKIVILRSGDVWHREILRNAAAEMANLGFPSASVQEMGGAHLRFEPNGTITIHGSSQQYGACDKEYAAKLVGRKYPDRKVHIEW